MPVIWTSRTRARGLVAPQQFTDVNWASPFADGLNFVFPCAAERSLETNANGIKRVESSQGLRPNPSGGGLSGYVTAATSTLNSVDGTPLIGIDNVNFPNGTFTFLAQAYITGSGANPGWYATNTDSTHTTWFIFNGGTYPRSRVQNVDKLATGEAGFYEENVLHQWSITVDANTEDVYFYRDGEAFGSDLTTAIALPTPATHWNVYKFGKYQAEANNNEIQGFHDQYIFWDRVLSQDELKAYWQHPWDIYKTQARTYFIPDVAGATVSPNAGSITITGESPTVALSIKLAPTAGAMTVTGEDPTVALSQVINLTGGAINVAGSSITVSSARIVTTAGRTMTLEAPNRTVVIGNG